MIQLHDLHFTPYLSESEVQSIVKQLAFQLHEKYQHTTPLFIGVLNGSFVFLADLVRYYPGACEIAFVKYSSYKGTSSSGKVKTDLDFPALTDKTVIVVEDIVDTGNTLVHIYKELERHSAASVSLASLFLKPEVYNKDLPINFIGKEIPNKFIVGYGLDYNNLGRNLPGIYQLKTTQND